MAPLIARKRAVAVKIETTTGTAEALTATDGAFGCMNPRIQPQTNAEERAQQGSFQRHPSVISDRLGQFTGTFELIGGSATPAVAAALLPAMGYGVDTGTYTADNTPPEGGTSTTETVTIGLYEDGTLTTLHGAMGTGRIVIPASKKVYLEVTFTGIPPPRWTPP